MAISFIGAASAVGTQVGLPAHQAGDLIVIYAYRTVDNTAIQAPAGFSADNKTSTAQDYSVVGYKLATSNAEISGTWVGASVIVVHVYRGASGIGFTSSTPANGGTNYPLMSLKVADGSSWVAMFAGGRTAPVAGEASFAGVNNRTAITNTVGIYAEAVGLDSARRLTVWGGTVSGRYRSTIVEILSSERLAWTPGDVTSAKLVAWYDATDMDSLLLDGDSRVFEWRSKANSFKVTQGNVNDRPYYSSTGYNNKPALLLNANGQHLQGPAPSTLPLGDSPSTMSGVAPYLIRRGDYTTLFYYGSADGRKARSISAAGEAVSAGYYGNDLAGNVRWTGFDRMFISSISNTGLVQQWVDDGALQSEQKSPLQTPANTTFWIGRSINGDSWWNPIQEIIMYDAVLSADDRNKLFSYYAWKWGMESKLSTNNPYRTAPPPLQTTGPVNGAVNGILPSLQSVATGRLELQGTVNGVLPLLSSSGAAMLHITGSVSTTLPVLQSSAQGRVDITGQANGILPALISQSSGEFVPEVIPPPNEGAAGAILPILISNAKGELLITAKADSILPALQGSSTGRLQITGRAVGTLPLLQSVGAAKLDLQGVVNATLPALQSEAKGEIALQGRVNTTLPALISVSIGELSEIEFTYVTPVAERTLSLAATVDRSVSLATTASRVVSMS